MRASDLTADDLTHLQLLIGAYAHVRDDDDSSKLDTVFTDDATFDMGFPDGPSATGMKAIQEMCDNLPRPRAIHYTTNMVVADGEGDSVQLRSKYLAIYDAGGMSRGEYRDEAVKTAVGWRLRRRMAVPRVIAT